MCATVYNQKKYTLVSYDSKNAVIKISKITRDLNPSYETHLVEPMNNIGFEKYIQTNF